MTSEEPSEESSKTKNYVVHYLADDGQDRTIVNYASEKMKTELR